MSIAKRKAQAQRNSNIFDPPDNREKEENEIRKENYRMELEHQIDDNARQRKESSFRSHEHPLESRVERHTVSMRKRREDDADPEPEYNFFFGSQDPSPSDIHRHQQDYQDQLLSDAAAKREYLAHKDENDMKNRKPVVRNSSPPLDREFVIGGDNRSASLSPREAKQHGRGLSKKEQSQMQYKLELDQQVDTSTRMKAEEQNRLVAEDKAHAQYDHPYGGNNNVDRQRKEKIAARQQFLEQTSQNFPRQKSRDAEIGKNSTFCIGEENFSGRDNAKKQAAYKSELDAQMGLRAVRKEEEKNAIKLENEKFANQRVPYFGNHGDDE